MKKWLFLCLILTACEKPIKQNVISQNKLVVEPVILEPSVIKAAQFCASQGRSFLAYEENDWISIGQGYEYRITCGEKQ